MDPLTPHAPNYGGALGVSRRTLGLPRGSRSRSDSFERELAEVAEA